jgi:hypothetical protein
MQAPRRFLDYIVDGNSLYERHGFDLISYLGWFVREEDEKAARRLLRDEPPDLDNRVAIYVCPEDADLLCGALTATVERQGPEIVWRDLANSYFDSVADSWHHDTTPFADWPELRFDAAEYWRAITERPAPVLS